MTCPKPASLFVAAVVLLLGLVSAHGCVQPTQPSPDAFAQDRAASLEPTAPVTPEQRRREYEAAYENGLRFAGRGQYALALQAFEQALAADPTSTQARFNLGACYEAIGDPLRAINIYRGILETNPDDADCYANLGTSFIKMYLRDKSPTWRKMARDSWQRSLSINPDQPDVKAFLAQSESLE